MGVRSEGNTPVDGVGLAESSVVVVVAELRLRCERLTPARPEPPVGGDVFKLDLFSSLSIGGRCRVAAFGAVAVPLLGSAPLGVGGLEAAAVLLVELGWLLGALETLQSEAGIVVFDEVGPFDDFAEGVGSTPGCWGSGVLCADKEGEDMKKAKRRSQGCWQKGCIKQRRRSASRKKEVWEGKKKKKRKEKDVNLFFFFLNILIINI